MTLLYVPVAASRYIGRKMWWSAPRLRTVTAWNSNHHRIIQHAGSPHQSYRRPFVYGDTGAFAKRHGGYAHQELLFEQLAESPLRIATEPHAVVPGVLCLQSEAAAEVSCRDCRSGAFLATPPVPVLNQPANGSGLTDL